MSIKITIPNSSSDVLTFGSGNTPTAAQIAGIDSGSSNGQLALYTTASGTSTERVRVDASGNVGIGTSSPSVKLDIVGANNGSQLRFGNGRLYTYSTSSSGGYDNSLLTLDSNSSVSQYAWSVGGSEKVRIDSSGNLLVGGITVYASLTNSLQLQNANNIQIIYRNTGTTAGRFWRSGMDSGSTFTVYNDASTGMYMAYGATSWTANSDERLKTDLQPIENGAAKVASLRAVTGRFKTDDESVSRAFLIAQDVQAVLPEAVNAQDDEIGTLGVQYTDVIPLLVAAIKEQQAIITSLTDRITALENK